MSTETLSRPVQVGIRNLRDGTLELTAEGERVTLIANGPNIARRMIAEFAEFGIAVTSGVRLEPGMDGLVADGRRYATVFA